MRSHVETHTANRPQRPAAPQSGRKRPRDSRKSMCSSVLHSVASQYETISSFCHDVSGRRPELSHPTARGPWVVACQRSNFAFSRGLGGAQKRLFVAQLSHTNIINQKDLPRPTTSRWEAFERESARHLRLSYGTVGAPAVPNRWPAGPRTNFGGSVALPLTVPLSQNVFDSFGARFLYLLAIRVADHQENEPSPGGEPTSRRRLASFWADP